MTAIPEPNLAHKIRYLPFSKTKVPYQAIFIVVPEWPLYCALKIIGFYCRFEIEDDCNNLNNI
jgi:hypothetical protein